MRKDSSKNRNQLNPRSKLLKDGNVLSMEKRKKNMRRRVLAMLEDPNPVKGIYAMYGAHENLPLKWNKK